MRSFTPIELALAVALTGSLAAISIPAFVRDVHASRFSEPKAGLALLGEHAVAYAVQNGHFPDAAPLTPKTPPRGTKEIDPPGTWDTPAWRALDFRPAPDGAPHAFAFAFDSARTTFTARARGDLDGDGIFSTFEITGTAKAGEEPTVLPGMYVEAELE
jgi:type II secretory pathway pseudopilin PulG